MRRSSGAGTMAALMLTCVFGATLLLSLATGASVYRRVADRVEQSAAQRLGLTYITAKIHSYDEAPPPNSCLDFTSEIVRTTCLKQQKVGQM